MVRAISPTHSSYGFSRDLLFLQFSIESIPLLIPFLQLEISRILYSPAPKQQMGLFMMHIRCVKPQQKGLLFNTTQPDSCSSNASDSLAISGIAGPADHVGHLNEGKWPVDQESSKCVTVKLHSPRSSHIHYPTLKTVVVNGPQGKGSSSCCFSAQACCKRSMRPGGFRERCGKCGKCGSSQQCDMNSWLVLYEHVHLFIHIWNNHHPN